MASNPPHRSRDSSKKLKAGGVWKGENESDAELVESSDTNPIG